MLKKYSLRPRVKEWRDSISENYDIKEILFFGDFSNPGLRAEIPRIREVTNLIIDTQNTSPHYKKDFTDFIMLDYIYQKAMTSSDAGTFIVFTGDGHFSSVVRFLIEKCRKKVLIYAVKDSLSGMLKNVCTKSYEVPSEKDIELTYYSMIAKFINEYDNSGKRLSEPSFTSVVGGVSEYYGIDRETVKEYANKMVQLQYLKVTLKKISYNKRISTVCLLKQNIINDGIQLINNPVYLMIPAKTENKQKKREQ